MARTKQVSSEEKVFDLVERTARFGEAVIRLGKQVKPTTVSRPVVSQLVRSATSIGANYAEARAAQSGRDFDHKIGLCKKEASETMYWLRMMMTVEPAASDECGALEREAHELVMIFSAILKKRRS